MGGNVDPGEHPVDSIVREVMEETHVGIEVERMLWLMVNEPATYPSGDECHLNHGLLARWRSGMAKMGDKESTEVSCFPVDELPTPREAGLERMIDIALARSTGSPVHSELSPTVLFPRLFRHPAARQPSMVSSGEQAGNLPVDE